MPFLSKLFSLLTKEERRQAYLLLFLTTIVAFLDMLGVASIMPFMAVLGNPGVIQTNRWLRLVYERLGFTNTEDFLFFTGIAFFIVIAVSVLAKAGAQWFLIRFSLFRTHTLSCRLLENYFKRPYAWFLDQHSAKLGETILAETDLVMKEVITPFMQVMANIPVSLFLVLLIVSADPFLALATMLALGGCYGGIYLFLSRAMLRAGAERLLASKERFKVIQEALAGIKEVKVFGSEAFFLKSYAKPSYRLVKQLVTGQYIGMMPRFLLEILMFGGIMGITLYLFKTYGNFSEMLPILGLYALAGYRLVPSLQEIYNQSTKIRMSLPLLDHLSRDMAFASAQTQADRAESGAIVPQKAIAARQLRYSYPSAEGSVLNGLTIEIPVNATIGIVGSTGAGKTTFIDILLGLLEPSSGQLTIDDKALRAEDLPRWQRSLGYVPQHIYLPDESVASNIAFGVRAEQVDRAAVERAARIAKLHDFISTELPQGYDTMVGERGVRLSGGQRQRIGIARALYRDPSVLLFDEATSALDNLTEKAVMEAVGAMAGQKTIIMIAHRLSTVVNCDCIYLLDKGTVAAQGSYDELIESSALFRKMAGHHA